MAIKSKTWKINQNDFEHVKELISGYGSVEEQTTNEYEIWRLKVGKSQFILYSSGKLFNNQATSDEILQLRKDITELTGTAFLKTGREILVGLDETGKGEIIGHLYLCGASFPSNLSNEIEEIIGSADTKSHRTFEYWDGLYQEFDDLQGRGLSFLIQTIPPWHVDKYNMNKLMDISYKRIISDICRNKSPDQVSIVIDNYQIDDNLKIFLFGLEKNGFKILIEEKADDRYLEAKLASILAKREREKLMKGINKNFRLDDLTVGSGSASDLSTLAWLKRWKENNDPWPWFVKRSFKTIRELDGKIGKINKEDPPIRHELVSQKTKELFDKGRLSTSNLRINCLNCSSELEAIKITKDTSRKLDGRCTKCSTIIPDINSTLLYYNGTILPDSSAIRHGLLSSDLYGGKFFENFTVFLHKRVLHECDNRGGKVEQEKIANIASAGRIRVVSLPDDINWDLKPDDEIVQAAKKYNAILLTKDMGEYLQGVGLDIFTLSSSG